MTKIQVAFRNFVTPLQLVQFKPQAMPAILLSIASNYSQQNCVPLPLQYSLLAVTCYETRDVWSSKLVNRIGKMLHVQCDRAGCALCYVGNVKTALTCRERFTCICGHSCYVDHTVFKMCCAGQRWCVDVRDCCQEYYILYRSFLFVFLPYYLTVKSFFLQFTHSLRG